jgi:CDP-glucose 4,6-dehydratase
MIDNITMKEFYKNKKILVTGHTGFIGSWLTKWLTLFNANICGYSLGPPSKPNMYEILNLNSVIKDVRYDIRNTDRLRRVLQEFQPEIVFHLAAQPIVLQAYDNPMETFDVNVAGTVNLLNELRKIKSVKTIIVITSDKSYHNNEWVYPYRENDALGGKDPYSASKSCQDIVINSFRDSYFETAEIGISSIRAGNVIGGGDWGKYRIIPDIARAIENDDFVKLRNPDSVRPWQYVLDPISGMLFLAYRMHENQRFSGAWNFGPEPQSAKTVKELTEKFIEYYEKGKYEIERTSDHIESSYLQIDISKARKELGWEPLFDFNNAVKKTADWYKSYIKNSTVINILTERQINEYVNFKK